jgi:7-cyano-7-deazaguanine synthase
MTNARAVVLLSGGMDSATAAAMTKARGFELYALSFRYGQRHALELEAAGRVAAHLGVARHAIVDIDLRAFGGSALTAEIAVPKDRPAEAIGSGIPVTYVPARNTIFLSFALAWAETLGVTDIVIGVNALDYSGYPDCRPEYIAAFQHLANLATRTGTELKQRFMIHTPLILLSKREIVERGAALRLDYGLTLSCYDPSEAGEACGRCDACQLRLKGFREAGLEDPGKYQTAGRGER